MNDTPAPQWSRDGDDFAFTWTNLGVRIAATRIRDERDGLEVEFDVTNIDGQRLGFDVVNILSSRSKAPFSKALSVRGLKDHCRDMIEQCSYIIRREWRRLPPPVDLLALPPLSTKGVFLDDHGLATREEPTSWYGAGDNAKSLLAMGYGLAIAAGVPLAHVTPWLTGPVMYLDFEDRPWVAAQRMRAWMAGLGIENRPPFIYREMNRTLTDVAPALRRDITNEGVVLLIVDSYIMAAGDDPEKANTARRFHGALRWLDVASVVISHTTKMSASDPNASAYGSVVFTNQCRCTWLFFRGDPLPSVAGHATFVVNALQKKKNLGGWPNLALKIDITLDDRIPIRVEATRAEIKDDLDLATRTHSLPEQIEAVLKADGPMPADKIATRLGKEGKRGAKSIRTILNRHNGRRFAPVESGKRGKQIWGLASKRTDEPSSGADGD